MILLLGWEFMFRDIVEFKREYVIILLNGYNIELFFYDILIYL